MPSFNLPLFVPLPVPVPPPSKHLPRQLYPSTKAMPKWRPLDLVLAAAPESPARPALAVIQPPSPAPAQSARERRHSPERQHRRREREGTRRGGRGGPGHGHARSASDGAALYRARPLPSLPPSPPPPSPPEPVALPRPPPSPPAPSPHSRPTLPRSRSEPLRPSPLAAHPPSPSPSPSPASAATPRRGRSSSNRSLSSPPGTRAAPSPSPSPAPAPAATPPRPLSRRYVRSASLSFLSGRSPVQERSVPRFSSSAPPFPPSSSSSSFSRTPFPSRSPSPDPTAPAQGQAHALLVESLVLRTLARRLSERLERSRALSERGEAAGLGGLRSAREMWIWCAVRRCRGDAGDEARALHPALAPQSTSPRTPRHTRSRSLPLPLPLRAPSLPYAPPLGRPTSAWSAAAREESRPAGFSARARLPRLPGVAVLRPLLVGSGSRSGNGNEGAARPRGARDGTGTSRSPDARDRDRDRDGDGDGPSPFLAPARSAFVPRSETRHYGVRLPRVPQRVAAALDAGDLGWRRRSGRGIEDWSGGAAA